MHILLSLPVQLVAAIASVFIVGPLFNTQLVSIFYTISVIFKELLTAILPCMVFAFVSTGILAFKRNAPLVLGVILALVICSNILGTLIAYGIMTLVHPIITCTQVGLLGTEIVSPVQPLFNFYIPRLIPAHYALLAALFSGLFCSFFSFPLVEKVINKLRNVIELLLYRFFIPLLPLYVFGFFLKMYCDGVLLSLLRQYGITFIIIIGTQFLYLLAYYFVISGFAISRMWRLLQNMIPAYITGFSTMSGTASVPMAVIGTERNINNRMLAQMAIPIMATIHFLGDSISIPMLAMSTLVFFNGCIPAFTVYLTFVMSFCIAMFAASGVPGGGIFAVMPFLISIFGFTPEMTSVITALYFLLDSFGTAANIVGDGALTVLLAKITHKLGITSEK